MWEKFLYAFNYSMSLNIRIFTGLTADNVDIFHIEYYLNQWRNIDITNRNSLTLLAFELRRDAKLERVVVDTTTGRFSTFSRGLESLKLSFHCVYVMLVVAKCDFLYCRVIWQYKVPSSTLRPVPRSSAHYSESRRRFHVHLVDRLEVRRCLDLYEALLPSRCTPLAKPCPSSIQFNSAR